MIVFNDKPIQQFIMERPLERRVITRLAENRYIDVWLFYNEVGKVIDVAIGEWTYINTVLEAISRLKSFDNTIKTTFIYV